MQTEDTDSQSQKYVTTTMFSLSESGIRKYLVETCSNVIMKSRFILGLSLFVAVLLVAGMLYPGMYGDPYEPPTEIQSYYIAHESTTEDIDHERQTSADERDLESVSDSTPLEDFDEEKQRLFEKAYDSQHDEIYTTPDDEEYESYVDVLTQRDGYRISVCTEWTLTCDRYKSAPTYPDDAFFEIHSKANGVLTVVEYEAETYAIVQRHSAGPIFHGLVGLGLRLGLFGPLALAIGATAVSARDAHPRTVLALTGYGIGIGALGLVAPYLYMLTGIDVQVYAVELVVVTWSVITVSLVYLLWIADS